MEEITQWEHYKLNNYLALTILFVLFSILMVIEIENEAKWISIFPFLIGTVVIPVGNYLSWKKKFK